MQGKATIIVVALLSLLFFGLIGGIIYLVLSDNSADTAILETGDISENDFQDNTIAENRGADEEPDESSNEVVDLTGHPLVGTWKNTLDDIYDVDVSFMEITLEFRANGVAIRESVNISFRYEWVLEDDVLHMKSFGAWGNTHNPENDRIYVLTWITPDSFSLITTIMMK